MFTKEERENLAKKYVPLVKKITNQFFGKNDFDYDELEGFAWEGFVIAMNKYDENRSSMTFQSYAAYGIRNGILNGINSSSRTIKVSYYKQKKMKELGEEMPTASSIDALLERYEMDDDRISELGVEDEYGMENPWDELLKALKENFDEDWVDMFMCAFGLDGHEVEKSKDIADRYGISPALVTIRKNKMIDFIKSKPELLEILRELL